MGGPGRHLIVDQTTNGHRRQFCDRAGGGGLYRATPTVVGDGTHAPRPPARKPGRPSGNQNRISQRMPKRSTEHPHSCVSLDRLAAGTAASTVLGLGLPRIGTAQVNGYPLHDRPSNRHGFLAQRSRGLTQGAVGLARGVWRPGRYLTSLPQRAAAAWCWRGSLRNSHRNEMFSRACVWSATLVEQPRGVCQVDLSTATKPSSVAMRVQLNMRPGCCPLSI